MREDPVVIMYLIVYLQYQAGHLKMHDTVNIGIDYNVHKRVQISVLHQIG